MTRLIEVQKKKKMKSMIDFDKNHTNSIKSIAIKKIQQLNWHLVLWRGRCWCLARHHLLVLPLFCIIFEVLIKSKILKRLDLSHNFWKKFNAQNPKLKKRVGLYKIESIDNVTLITIAVHPKEYFEKYRNREINKKHKKKKKILLECLLKNALVIHEE